MPSMRLRSAGRDGRCRVVPSGVGAGGDAETCCRAIDLLVQRQDQVFTRIAECATTITTTGRKRCAT